MKTFITKLLSTTLVLLISLSLINIREISAKGGNDPRVYEFTIPATVQVKGDNPSFTIEGGYSPDGFSSFIINISSNNGFKLISDENVELSYGLSSSTPDDQEITTEDDYIEYKTSLTDNKFSKTFNININSSAVYAGNYKDTLTFEVETVLKEHTVTYHTDGGLLSCEGIKEVESGKTYEQFYTVEDLVILPTNVSKEGCTFKGWYTTNDFSFDPVTSFEGWKHFSRDFYAKWEPITTDDIPIVEEETPTEEVVEEIKEEEPTEQEIVEEEKKEEETIPEVVEEVVNEEEAND
ncbi:MAG: InlB B-repeat-containing protein [Firmicutes bacterium]|nr:InlB B-repeat-containing protein [Candidatus Colivicinus equi]